ncbi:alpha/beta hydrolase [Aquimarina sp. M1]
MIDSVLISDKTKETFAMYLPNSVDKSAALPIVFIFDPGGQGKRGIAPFIKTSEAYGYMLVCSNHTKNGPYDRNFEITNRLFEFVFANFRIKQNEMYVSGFSGGSRLASAIAVLTGRVAGVIACGAGFSQEQSHIPTFQKFSYVGVCGNRDMNYQEMIRAKGYLQKLKFTNTLITYDGNHTWPSDDQILKAFDWLEIQAHLKGIKEKEAYEIYKSYEEVYHNALKAQKENNLLIAVENYERALITYDPFYDVDSVASRLNNIIESKSYKKLLKKVAQVFKKEKELTKKLTTRVFEAYKQPDKIDIFWWKKELTKLKKLDKKEDSETKKMLERLRFHIFVTSYTANKNSVTKANKKQKELTNILRKLLKTEHR